MTYLPVKTTTTPAAAALTDADTLSVTQSGTAKTATLGSFKTFLLGSTGSTGATGGTTGSTSGGTGGTTGVGLEAYTYPEGTSGPYGGIGDAGTGAGPQAYLYGRSLGDLFGTYTYPNPGGTDGPNATTLQQAMAKLIADMGVKPKTMNAFNTKQDANSVANETFAYGWHNDNSVISGPSGYLRPIIGVKLGFSNQGWSNPATYDDIANGVYDNQYLGEVNKWIEFGYPHLVYRYAYEMNGTFMPDYFGSNDTDNARFKAAMRHVHLLVKNRCTQTGTKVEFTFEPTYMNYSDTDIMNAYPGDDVVDIIGCDQYNPCYNRTLQIYNASGAPTGQYAANQATWMQDPNNRRKFWNYPGIKDDGDNHYSYGCWSALRALSIAKAKGKAIAFGECGTGGISSDSSLKDNYLGNDPVWVQWFWRHCQSAISQGVRIAHINLWNIYADDGQWWFSNNDSDPQPLVKAAMRKYFGDGSYAGGPTPTPGNGSVGVSGPATTGSTGGTTGGSAGATGSAGTTGTATVAISDTSSHSATLTLNAGYKTYYQNETGLALDVYYYLDTGTNKPTLGSSADSQVSSMAITQNGTATVSSPGLAGVTTYPGGGSTASTGSASTGIATAKVSDLSGHTATLTLNGYQDFYGSNTGLNLNIYYYLDTGTNKPTVGSSADSQISSMLITRNGTTTVASGGLAGVTTYA